MRYFIYISYLGTNYHGWQVQENALSIQQILNNSLSKILKEDIKTVGAGRTDTGVHALNQVAHFDFNQVLDNNDFLYKINSILPGVGKSTLINKLSNKANQKISEISNKSNKGKHRTTFSQIFDIDNKTKIIDTPGIKTFELFDMEKNQIKNYFPEFIEINEKCKFNNCLHINEPNCQIKKEIDKSIWKRRYNNYLSMIQDH